MIFPRRIIEHPMEAMLKTYEKQIWMVYVVTTEICGRVMRVGGTCKSLAHMIFGKMHGCHIK